MKLNKLLYKILPTDVFSKIRIKYYTSIKKLHKPLTESEFENVLRSDLGIRNGSVVFVHSSFDFLNINFSPYKLLTLLIDAVGEDGTLIFPAWHFNYRAEDYLKKNLVFDVKKSPTVMGLLPELARRYPGAYRSNHPTTSIVAIGKYAKELTVDHEKSIYPCGELSPYFKMMKYDALIVGIGVKAHFLSFVHCPEDVMQDEFPLKTRMSEVFVGKVKRADAEIIEVETLVAHSNIGKRDIPAFLKKYVAADVFSSYAIKGNTFYRANSVLLYDKLVELAKKGQTIYTV